MIVWQRSIRTKPVTTIYRWYYDDGQVLNSCSGHVMGSLIIRKQNLTRIDPVMVL